MSGTWTFRRSVSRFLLGLMGYHVEGTLPEVPRCVVAFAPHTSNWDFLILLFARSVLGRDVSYLAKHTLFRPPFGWFFRVTSGIPVDRTEKQRMVDAIASKFAERPELWLAMAPEGTRAKTDHWKSGFYFIAIAAKVPILLTAIDGGRKAYVVGDLLWPTGNVEEDLERIRAFYRDKRGLYPERAGEIRFKR
jgi:1-acyl-sn-glycerol-3-phosphate acyltransferase